MINQNKNQNVSKKLEASCSLVRFDLDHDFFDYDGGNEWILFSRINPSN